MSGNVTAVGFYHFSDKSLKKNIKPLESSLNKILSLSGYSFDWKSDNRGDIGVIAQEVEAVFPEIVKTDTHTGFKSVQYENLIAPLIEAVKTQQIIIDEQTNNSLKSLSEQQKTIDSQKEKIISLEMRLKNLENNSHYQGKR